MTTDNYYVPPKLVKSYLNKNGEPKTIREIGTLCKHVDRRLTAKRHLRPKLFPMFIGNPKQDTPKQLIDYQHEALDTPGVSNTYAPCDGLPQFKKEASYFLKRFCDVKIPHKYCIPTVGGAHGLYLTMKALHAVLKDNNDKRDTMLLFAPYFPVHELQADDVGFQTESLEFYDFRGKQLRNKLEEMLSKGNIHSILYSNPNNPTWLSLTEEELRIIGEVANKYNILVIEDLAYFGMDFRYDYSHPGIAPFQPTVAKYCNNYVIVLSTSKFISYPGERCGFIAISPSIKLCENVSHMSLEIYNHISYKGMAVTVSSVPHSTQIATSRFLHDLSTGKLNFRKALLEYRDKASEIKKAFIENGFYIPYAHDCGHPLADGFYFTISYTGFTSKDLFKELSYYGIFVTPLNMCGSEKDGVRICISFVDRNDIPELKERLKAFALDHPIYK